MNASAAARRGASFRIVSTERGTAGDRSVRVQRAGVP